MHISCGESATDSKCKYELSVVAYLFIPDPGGFL